MSVSLKASVCKWTSSFTMAFPASKSAFLARILANEKAETLGSDETSESVVFESVTIFLIATATVVSTAIWGSAISVIWGVVSSFFSLVTLSGSDSTTVDLSVIE